MRRTRFLPGRPRGSGPSQPPRAARRGLVQKLGRGLRRRYGAGPLHLLGLVATTALAAYAAVRFVPRNPVGVACWIVGAAVVHDLVLLPAYSLADRAAAVACRRRPGRWLNHLRFPAVWSGLLLIIFFPLISGHPENFERLGGTARQPFLAHWLLLSGLLFGGSALVLALRLRLERRRDTRGSTSARTSARDG